VAAPSGSWFNQLSNRMPSFNRRFTSSLSTSFRGTNVCDALGTAMANTGVGNLGGGSLTPTWQGVDLNAGGYLSNLNLPNRSVAFCPAAASTCSESTWRAAVCCACPRGHFVDMLCH
jgi:hypothetical protein